MITTRVYIVFYSGRPMDFQKLSDLSGVEPTSIEVKGEERISRVTGKIVKIQAKNGEWIPRINEFNAEWRFFTIRDFFYDDNIILRK